MAVSDDLSRLSQRAKEAEDRVTAFAIDFAYSAIDEAEYAVLDAVLYREDADAVPMSYPVRLCFFRRLRWPIIRRK